MDINQINKYLGCAQTYINQYKLEVDKKWTNI